MSTVSGSFDEEVFEMMLRNNERPIVMPLSNPTSKSECTFEEAYRSGGGGPCGAPCIMSTHVL